MSVELGTGDAPTPCIYNLSALSSYISVGAAVHIFVTSQVDVTIFLEASNSIVEAGLGHPALAPLINVLCVEEWLTGLVEELLDLSLHDGLVLLAIVLRGTRSRTSSGTSQLGRADSALDALLL